MAATRDKKSILADWEATYRQGLLTFWLFTALGEDTLSVGDLREKVIKLTDKTYQPAEQSIYRILRKQKELKLIDHTMQPNSKGPAVKMWFLTDLGKQLFKEFTDTNIKLFYKEEIKRWTK